MTNGNRTGGPFDGLQEELELTFYERCQTIPLERSEPLFHYTGCDAFLKIVQGRKLWATHFAHLNDRQEFKRGAQIVAEVFQEIIAEHHI